MSDLRNSTTARRASIDPTPKSIDGESWRAACDMEKPLWAIHDILTTIGLIAPSLAGDDDAIAALQRQVTFAQNEWKAAEAIRGQLFHLNHPNRGDFNNHGWPVRGED